MFKIKTQFQEPVRIDIRSDNSTLRPQEAMVLQEKYKALDIVDKANDTLNSKALNLLQSGGIVAALIAATNIPGFLTENSGPLGTILAVVGLIAFIFMIYLSIKGFIPDDYFIPGKRDRDEIYTKYIAPVALTTFWKIIDDLHEVIGEIIKRNKRKAKYIKYSSFLLIIEVGALACILLIGALF